MIGLRELWDAALNLPEVEEGPPVRAAHRIVSFKVAGKSFLGLETGGVRITVSLAKEKAKAVAAEHPDACEEIWGDGKVFMGLRVDSSRMPARRVRELIQKSWSYNAPKCLLAEDSQLTSHTQAP